MADFNYRVSGLVTFSDNTELPFEAQVVNDTAYGSFDSTSLEAFRQAYSSTAANKSTAINALLALFVGPTHTLTPLAPTTSKTVTDLIMQVSGSVAYSNNTNTSFAAQYSFANGWLIADETNYNSVKTYDSVIVTTAWKNLVVSALEKLCGSGRATITT